MQENHALDVTYWLYSISYNLTISIFGVKLNTLLFVIKWIQQVNNWSCIVIKAMIKIQREHWFIFTKRYESLQRSFITNLLVVHLQDVQIEEK